ncbi:hypothetical protein PHYBLDRAFT_139010 [Phycomyces blakesleeanus NRRL 1555(-)]|uniref:BTB domain-containing protein n=1 Tax=Phycomyces blakesleeanus (strain ATCC 8743b / DSM 1359 / FGSC 10004 / NBRC 33097 / NRRL 1555) TaxID=763407 RepID=A0A167REF8_PHYB8|nr:hypothetical protein PHYBLDRAFT_139010 [Phycomyces blakesleeanus NRRL 1555(-)]OAD81458.1 hypothetical protein PHYBLDRAFT_139010 [Phycomyces blakesleeanus NRRL 1555(-)]|eukprot:XP_018299498.1 hypothetical protein PHYBLDRAFT_139010 [Phycomyces blakesleeanus NRRL 1555(-)]
MNTCKFYDLNIRSLTDSYTYKISYYFEGINDFLSEDLIVSFEVISGEPLCLLPFVDFSSYHDSSEFFDVAVKVINTQNEHDVVAAATSPWIKTLFTAEMRDYNKEDVIIRGIYLEIFEKILIFIHSSVYDVKDIYEVSEITKAVDQLELSIICNIMFRYLRSNIDITNMWPVWDLAVKYECKETEIAYQKITVIKVLQIDHLSPPVPEQDIYNSILSWRQNAISDTKSRIPKTVNPNTFTDSAIVNQNNSKETKKSLKSLEKIEKAFIEMIQLIRFSQMSLEYLLRDVKTNEILTKTDICMSSISQAISSIICNNLCADSRNA